MKTPSDELFKFIQSLSWQEKRHVSNSFSSDETYTKQLFQYLCSVEVYDENKLLKALPFLKKGSLKYNKHDLFEILLKKIEHYYLENDEEQYLYSLLFQIRLLRRKRIFKKALLLLKHAQTIAKKNNLFLLQVQLQTEYEKLSVFLNEKSYFDTLKQNNNTNTSNLFQHYNLEQQCEQYLSELLVLNLKNVGLTPLQRKERIKSIHAFSVASKKTTRFEVLPDKIRLQMEFLGYYCLLLLGDYLKAKKCFISFFNDYEKSSLANDKETLLLHIANGTSLSVVTNDQPLLWELDKKADNAFAAVPIKEKSVALITHHTGIKVNTIGFLSNQHDFKTAKIMSEQLYQQIISSDVRSDLKKIFLGNLMQIYLYCNEPKNALKIRNIIVNDETLSGATEHVNFAINILTLAIFYDLNMLDNVESMVRSCKRDKLFNQQSFIYKYLISFFAALVRAKDGQKTKELFVGAIKIIDAVKKTDTASLGIINNIEIRYWLSIKL